MLVIGAGLGRTSTSSFTMAMARLGLKSYHMEENMGNPVHKQMWADHARRQLSQKEKDNSLVPEILDRLAADGYNATADFPAILLHQEFLERYPDALVVLTVRSSAEQWAQSVNGTLLSIMKAMERVPFRWTPAAADTLDMMEWMFRGAGIGITRRNEDRDGRFSYPSLEDLAKTYNDWNAKIIESVPAKKLLVFAAQDGWKPLCDFLTTKLAENNLQSNIVEANCNEVLALGEPYPYGNSSAFFRRIYLFMSAISILVEWAPLWVIPAGLVILQRRRRQLQGINKSKGE